MSTASVTSLDDKYRIVIDNIGLADVSMIKDLTRILSIDELELRQKISQAPSALVQNIPYTNAIEIANQLSHFGMRVRISSMREPFLAGKGDCELAISITDYSRLTEITGMIMSTFGLDQSEVRKRLSNVPAVIACNISMNNADILAKRFAEYGVEVDIVQPKHSIFDALVYTSSMQWRKEVFALANSYGAMIKKQEAHLGLCDISGLDYYAARDFENIDGVMLINQAYERYDIYVNGLVKRQNINRGMGENETLYEKVVHSRLRRRRPARLVANVRLERARLILNKYYNRNVKVYAELTARKIYQIRFSHYRRNRSTEKLLLSLKDVDRKQIQLILKGHANTLAGPFNYHQARWLRHLLEASNTNVELLAGRYLPDPRVS